MSRALVSLLIAFSLLPARAWACACCPTSLPAEPALERTAREDMLSLRTLVVDRSEGEAPHVDQFRWNWFDPDLAIIDSWNLELVSDAKNKVTDVRLVSSPGLTPQPPRISKTAIARLLADFPVFKARILGHAAAEARDELTDWVSKTLGLVPARVAKVSFCSATLAERRAGGEMKYTISVQEPRLNASLPVTYGTIRQSSKASAEHPETLLTHLDGCILPLKGPRKYLLYSLERSGCGINEKEFRLANLDAVRIQALRDNVLGLQALDAGNLAEAEGYFRRSILRDSRFGMGQFNLACALARRGRPFSEGKPLLERALGVAEDREDLLARIRRDPDLAEWRKTPEFGAWSTGRFKEAPRP